MPSTTRCAPPELLVWTEPHSGMRVTTEFVALGPRPHRGAHPPDLRARGASCPPRPRPGSSSSLDRFAAYLAGSPHRTSTPTASTDGARQRHATTTTRRRRRRRRGVPRAGRPARGRRPPTVWDAPSLCEGWRTREVVAHMTMPARYDGPAFMAELEAAGGDFTRLSNTVAARDGALAAARLARRPALRRCCTRGSRPAAAIDGRADALRHPRARHHRGRPAGPAGARRRASPGSSRSSPHPDAPNLFGVDLSGVELRADDLDWSCGLGRRGDRAGAGARPRGLRPPAAAGPPGRRGGRPLHLRLERGAPRPTTIANPGRPAWSRPPHIADPAPGHDKIAAITPTPGLRPGQVAHEIRPREGHRAGPHRHAGRLPALRGRRLPLHRRTPAGTRASCGS